MNILFIALNIAESKDKDALFLLGIDGTALFEPSEEGNCFIFVSSQVIV